MLLPKGCKLEKSHKQLEKMDFQIGSKGIGRVIYPQNVGIGYI